MATFNLINDWLDNLHEDVDAASDQFVIALSNTAPGSEGTPPTGDGQGVLANVTEVAYTYCSSRNITTTSSSQSGGTYKLILQDITISASGGAVGPFRYIYIYDDTPSTPADPLICYYDYGSGLTLNDGESLDIDFDDSNGLYQLS
jgi:hypothetical protein